MRGESAVPTLERYVVPTPSVDQQSDLGDASASVSLPIDLEADMREYIRREAADARGGQSRGYEIVAHLEKAGLKTAWDGSFQHRIGVSIDWKRRRQD